MTDATGINLKGIGIHMSRPRYSEGTLEKVGRRKKMWRGYWYVYKDGKRVRRKTTIGPATMPKHEAKEKLSHAIAESRGELPPAPEKPTVAQLWDRYCAVRSGNWSKITENTLRSLFKTAVLPKLGGVLVANLTYDPLQSLLNDLARANRSLSALQKVRIHLKSMVEYALGEGWLERHPCPGKKLQIPMKLVKKQHQRHLAIVEVRALLKAAEQSPREHLIVRLFLVGGFRPGELFALRVNDVEPGQIRIDEAWKQAESSEQKIGEPKSLASNASVPIPPDLERELRKWISGLEDQSPEAWLFPSATGTAFDYTNHLDRHLRPLATAAGIEGLDHRVLRRTCATFFRQDIKSAQAQLRHAKPTITAEVYQQTITAEHRAAVEALDKEFRRGKAKVVQMRRKAG